MNIGYLSPDWGFNTQPPEGGWRSVRRKMRPQQRFNTQPPEGGWDITGVVFRTPVVSTHSRLKAAGYYWLVF